MKLKLKTTKPFSTISYNSIEFLKLKLDDLVARNIFSFYAFVYHYKEEDENKDHIHLICFPNGQYQTDQLKDYLTEIDSNNPLKPLGVMPFCSSKWGDWFLYSSHDVGYLASKGQSRKYHYNENDFICSEPDYLKELVKTIDYTKYAKTQDFISKIKNGIPFEKLVETGQVPVTQFNQFLSLYNFVIEHTTNTFRNGNLTHSPSETEVDFISIDDNE